MGLTDTFEREATPQNDFQSAACRLMEQFRQVHLDGARRQARQQGEAGQRLIVREHLVDFLAAEFESPQCGKNDLAAGRQCRKTRSGQSAADQIDNEIGRAQRFVDRGGPIAVGITHRVIGSERKGQFLFRL